MAFCYLLCVLSLVSVVDILFGPGHGRPAFLMPGPSWLRATTAMANAILFGLIGFGILKKLKMAWRLGWVLMVFLAIQFSLGVAVSAQVRGKPLAASAGAILGCAVVGVFWGSKWWGLRGCFSEDKPSSELV
ncbi:MAG TPA: hypothetical protein VGF97_12520 [Rhizomicrobium sp.]|jgi:uncharacterized membrane protein YfcA